MGKITAVFGTHDDNTLQQLQDVASRAAQAAIMADGHLGFIMPIGGVAAYYDHVSVMGVGVDIACGNCAMRLDTKLDDLDKSDHKRLWMLNTLADDIQRNIAFGMGRNNKHDNAPTDHALFSSDSWTVLRERAGHGVARQMYDKAKEQLGTVGGGNHYVDVFVDEEGYLWVGVHFGSRGLGHNIAMGFNTVAAGGTWGDRIKEQEGLISMSSSMGQDYWKLMELAGEYAYAGREWVAQTVCDIIGGRVTDMVHNNHNFAWKEQHFMEEAGELADVVVVRKGATPAFPGQRGFIGGSMGDNAVIVEGAPEHNNGRFDDIPNVKYAMRKAMFSTVHGAGRVMSRTEAKGKTNRKTGELKLGEDGQPVKPPRITQDMMDTWLQRVGVIRRGGEVDEAPQAYRRLTDVLEAQGPTINVLHTLQPIVVVMAGSDVFDPYKD